MAPIHVPDTQHALKVEGPGAVNLDESCPVPAPQADEVLVRVVCVGLNPFDWKALDMSPAPGATWGCDMAGEVLVVGSGVNDFAVGDRVAGAVPGNNPDEPTSGAFAQYVSAPASMLFRIPSKMSFEEAATLGCGMLTVGLSLHHVLQLPLPYSEPSRSGSKPYVLVYGGGTATGTLAIQVARLAGLIPITTCSPRNFPRVKALGAAGAWDYRSPSCAEEMRDFTQDQLAYALDCITDSGSMKICYAAIGSAGGKYVGLDQFPIRGHTRRNVRPEWIIAWTVLGKPINMAKPYRRDAKPRDRAFHEGWRLMTQNLLDRGDILTHPMEVSNEGLEGIAVGADLLRKGAAGGKKLVFRVA